MPLMRRWIRHLPNAITAARGLAGFGVAALLLGWEANVAAFFLFIAAVSTDLLDGWLARKLDARSEVGLWLDPLSDKTLVGLTWLALLLADWAPLWLAATILARDVLVGIAWWVARSLEVRIEPTLTGRLAISFEGVALPLLLLHHEWMGVHWASAGVILGVITLALSVLSAAQYAVRWGAAGRARG